MTEQAVTKIKPTQLADTAPILEIISRAASDPAVDIDKMERLMQMHERMVSRNAESEFNRAMTDAQTACGRISADQDNKQTRSRYASYAQLDRVLRPIYTERGFALSFDTGETTLENYVRVLCHVSHCGGYSKTYHIDMPADGKGAKGGDVMTKTHATGSASSYGMRYLLKMIFNVAIGDDDDDGNEAGGRNIAEELLEYNALWRDYESEIHWAKQYLLPKYGELQNQVNVTEARANLAEIPEDDRRRLWRAPTKGGCFTTLERSLLKEPPEDSL